MAASIQYDNYWVTPPEGGFLTVDAVRALCTAAEHARLMDHALCLACLNGNAFPGLIEQYVPEAYANLLANGWTLTALADGALQPLSERTTGNDTDQDSGDLK